MTDLEPLQQIDRTYVRFRKRKLIYFSGCDYFRLASDPRVLSALSEGSRKFGFNVAASRKTSGHHVLYDRLEKELARFFGSETAVVVGGGYLAGLVAAQSMAGEFDLALVDADAHAALLDAARFLECPVRTFAHFDPESLAAAIKESGRRKRLLVLTDGMFARDGAVVPLRRYLHLLPRNATILVDDAHGAGVVGVSGRGSLEHEGADSERARIIQVITLSKAFGCYGGAILGSKELREKVLNRSRIFVGHTPVPLPAANAAITAIQVLKSDPGLRRRLERNRLQVQAGLARLGLLGSRTPGPIFPVYAASPAQRKRMHASLLANGIYPPLLHYNGTPRNGYFRFVISSEHTPEQLSLLLRVLEQAL
jgi:7-keto-8-aminopelargonate synthetase-like enzyme